MTLAKFLLRTVVTAVVTFALGYVGHQLLLGRDYVSMKACSTLLSLELLLRSNPELFPPGV
jgi:hypothetical protein